LTDSNFDENILKHLNDPQNTVLADQVGQMRKLSADNETNFKEIELLWELSAQTSALKDVDVKISVRNFKKQLFNSKSSRPKLNFAWIRNIAALAFLGTLAIWIYKEKFDVNYIVKETHLGIDSVRLADGTKIVLSDHSVIRYPDHFAGNDRRISLIKGEAFFQVAKDSEHPFHISVKKSTVSVLGTSFNIHITDSDINLAVKTGRVRFSPDSASVPSILTAGQAISYNFILKRVKVDDGSNSNSWLTNVLTFEDMPLNEVCKQLSKYYHVNIVLVDKQKSANKFNATFDHSSLDEVLNVLKATYQIEIIKEKNSVKIKTINNN
jgi:transmembrane sensor